MFGESCYFFSAKEGFFRFTLTSGWSRKYFRNHKYTIPWLCRYSLHYSILQSTLWGFRFLSSSKYRFLAEVIALVWGLLLSSFKLLWLRPLRLKLTIKSTCIKIDPFVNFRKASLSQHNAEIKKVNMHLLVSIFHQTRLNLNFERGI